MQHTAPGPVVVAVVNDLMFGSRIRAAAQHANAEVIFVRTAADLVARAADAALVLLDLDTRWLDAPAAITALRSDTVTARKSIVAFGPHTDADALERARTAGADRVLARSGFVKALPDLMASAIGGRSG